MPGAPWMRRGKPLRERSTGNIVRVFIVFPILAGGALLAWVVVNAMKRGADFTFADWFFQVGWAAALGLLLMLAPPAVGWRELKRRRQARNAQAARKPG